MGKEFGRDSREALFFTSEHHLKLLIAEDSPRLLKTLTKVLEREGYTVDAVGDGDTALNYIQNSTYDGLVLDVMMPGKDGLDVLK